MSESVIKTRVTPHFRLVIEQEDGSELVWRLCPTYKAIAKIEETIKLDIKRWESWPLPSCHFPAVVWGMLDKFNPEVKLEEVHERLNPEAQAELGEVVMNLMFPTLKELIEKAKASAESGATASPNVQMGTPTV